MFQHDFYFALARATGEHVRTLKRRGFSLLERDIRQLDSESIEAPPLMVDWDEVEAQRMARASDA